MLAPRFSVEKLVRFIGRCAGEAADLLVPTPIALAAKVSLHFANCFCLLDLTDRDDILNQVAKGNEDLVIEGTAVVDGFLQPRWH